MADFRVSNDPWATFKRENLNLNFEYSYESDGREKGAIYESSRLIKIF